MRGLIDNSVNIGGNQTITGVKTFGNGANFGGAISGTSANFSNKVMAATATENGSVVTTTYRNSKTIGFGNGFKIASAFQSSAQTGTVTFLQPFAETTPSIATSIFSEIKEPRAVRVYDITYTNFKFECYRQNGSGAILAGTSFEYIAVGR